MSADLIHGYKLCFIATQVAKKWKTWQNLNSVLQISAKKTITLILFIGFIPRYLPGEQPLYF